MFTELVVQPIFNLLVLIYALLPGHNFGLALVIFTIIIRMLLWPFLRKQLHQAKQMKKLQPELKKVKKAAKGDRQKEAQMMMELYKEKGISPFGTLPTLIIQFIILIGLYSGLLKIIKDPHSLITFAYPALQHLDWMEQLSRNIHEFDNTFLGVVDLSKSAVTNGAIYLPALVLVVGSGVVQYFQGKQLLPSDKDAKSLKTILKEAGSGKQADQSEVNAAVGRFTIYLLPVFIIFVTLGLASALALYWFVGGLVGYIQQSVILRGDEEEMEELADEPDKNTAGGKKDPSRRRKGSKVAKKPTDIPEAEIVEAAATKKSPSKKNSKNKSKKKR